MTMYNGDCYGYKSNSFIIIYRWVCYLLDTRC